MTIRYVPYGTVRVSRRWRTVLVVADLNRVRFHVDSGHRTLLEQARMFRQNMHLVAGRWVPRPGRPLTAFPTPNAPHILLGRANHALDVNQLDGGADRLARWLHRHGVHAAFPVAGEPWHMVVGRRELKRLARKLAR